MANSNEAKPLSELEHNAEESRAQLKQTVDTLQSRVSPSAVKEEIKEYVRDTKNGLLHSIEQQITRNPLQTAAIAAGIAFPLWRLISSLPAPIVLIGAGIALSQTTSVAKQSIGSASAGNGQGVVSKAVAAGASAASTVENMGTQVAHTLSDAVHTAQDGLSESATMASDAISDAYHAGVDAIDRTQHELEETWARTQQSVVELISRHPVAAGVAGIAIGAFLASCIPTTAAENEAVGRLSDTLKDRARSLASDGVEAVKAAAEDVYQETVSQADDQGLTSAVARQAVRAVGDKVRDFAQQASQRLDQTSGME